MLTHTMLYLDTLYDLPLSLPYQLGVVVKKVPQNSAGAQVSAWTCAVWGLQHQLLTFDHIHTGLGLGQYAWIQKDGEEKRNMKVSLLQIWSLILTVRCYEPVIICFKCPNHTCLNKLWLEPALLPITNQFDMSSISKHSFLQDCWVWDAEHKTWEKSYSLLCNAVPTNQCLENIYSKWF